MTRKSIKRLKMIMEYWINSAIENAEAIKELKQEFIQAKHDYHKNPKINRYEYIVRLNSILSNLENWNQEIKANLNWYHTLIC